MIPQINPEETKAQLIKFIQEQVENAHSSGVVIGLSGGIDSTIVAHLAVEALDSENVLGISIPSDTTPQEDIKDARKLAKTLDIEFKEISLTKTMDALDETVDECTGLVGSYLALGNLQSRLRMAISYYFANALNYLVIGTGNKSEIHYGYFTKYGDGGVDFLPLANLYKTQLWPLAEHLQVDPNIIKKAPRAGLWGKQTDEKEMGIPYEQLDKILYRIIDKNETNETILFELNTTETEIEKVRTQIKKSLHKNKTPTTPPIL